ncbi:rna-directed dna polymerase from mobile element jockey-like [Limosa lapponica baueri]|uniref:Rna-directed dna polymerase from mobile element jockey-like n=1 Tax=Limosa lapponica baueri TaxID=1758121 RepID=A0A2I0T5H5_LIMLA|nr:rna-directed dna polymerase from mobile element jockey-like [Limosa lapponica baueri]
MYSHTLSVLIWAGVDDDSLTVSEMASRMRQYDDSLSHPLTVAAVEKLTEKTEKIIEKNEKQFDKLSRMEERSCSSPPWTNVAAVRRRCPPMRLTQRRQNTLRNILWFCICDYGEDMSKWDKKPTSALRA